MIHTPLPDPVLQVHDDFIVVRDDLVAGGTKRRILGSILQSSTAEEFVYASTAYGHGPLALAFAGQDLGRKVRLFYAARNIENRTSLMKQTTELGAIIVDVPLGYMSVVKARAKSYCDANPQSLLLPLGFEMDKFANRLTELALSLPVQPSQVWCAAGTGVLTRSLQKAWPDAEHHAVIVARSDADTGHAIRHSIAEKFTQVAKNLPPFPSAPHYDAKVWNVMKHHAKPGALLWNVGA